MSAARPIFLTRKFPPSVGGMETLAQGVWRSLVTVAPDARLIALGRSNRNLVWWLPVSLLRLIGQLVRDRSRLVLTGDALMYAVARPVLTLFRVPNATMIMGLDVTYANPLYRAVVLRALRRAPLVLSISTATAARAVEVGVAADRITVIRLGVQVPDVSRADRAAARSALHERLNRAPNDLLLLTLGRLVRRKGARWFVAEVLPQLPGNVHYVIAGDGPEAEAVTAQAATSAVSARVHLLGRVDDEERELVMRGADLFVQPNIAVDGDMEGFGLVTIEAAMRATPVLAADLEGIKDAVVAGETGVLLPSGDSTVWVSTLRGLLADPDALAELGSRFAVAAADRYGEAAMGRALAEALKLSP